MHLLFSFLLAISPMQQTRVSIDAGEIAFDAKTQKTCAKDVTLTLKDGSKIISRKAIVSAENLEGVVAEGVDGETIVYTGLAADEGKERRPFVIQAKKMCVSTEKELTLVAIGSVQISYDEQITAFGDAATYRGNGTVTLSGAKAHVVHESGAELHAKEFSYDPKLRKIDALDIELHVPEVAQDDAISGSASHGHFLIDENRFVFPKGVVINSKERISASTDGNVEVILDEGQLERIDAFGLTVAETPGGQKMVCPGKVLFLPNKKHLEAKAFSGKEISFSDKNGSLLSEYVRLQFLEPNNLAQIEKAMLKGNVKLSGLSLFPQQYALAHEVRIDLLKKKAHLKASEQDPVLFYDPEQNIELSAPKVSVKALPNGKMKAQGSGTVRLKFSSEEQERLRTIEKTFF